MADFPLYDAVATCRECGDEFPTKAFTPAKVQRFGLCEFCGAKAIARVRKRATTEDPTPKQPELTIPRRVWEPD